MYFLNYPTNVQDCEEYYETTDELLEKGIIPQQTDSGGFYTSEEFLNK